MKDIGELFTKYGSDKESNHSYGKYYQDHLPKKINKLLEIGVWLGGGIKGFQEFYQNEGCFHVINYIFGGEIISKKQLYELGITPHEGKQEDVKFLKSIDDIYTVIVDDGSHHSDSQIITFKQMFVNNLESGGLYVIEDIYGHVDGEDGAYWRRGKVNTAEDTIMGVMRSFLSGGDLVSQYFTKEESDEIVSLIKEVNIHEDKIIFISKS